MKAACALLSLVFFACSPSGNTDGKEHPAPPLPSTSKVTTGTHSANHEAQVEPMSTLSRRRVASRFRFGGGVRTTLLGHYTYKLHMDGWTKAQVRKLYGPPKEINTTKFRATAYHVVKSLPTADTQWYYPSGLSHRIIWFQKDKVVLALQENSTF